MSNKTYRAAIYLDYNMDSRYYSPINCRKVIRKFIKELIRGNKNVKLLGIDNFSVVVESEGWRYDNLLKKEGKVYKEEYEINEPKYKRSTKYRGHS